MNCANVANTAATNVTCSIGDGPVGDEPELPLRVPLHLRRQIAIHEKSLLKGCKHILLLLSMLPLPVLPLLLLRTMKLMVPLLL